MRWLIIFLLSSCPLLTILSVASTPNEQASSSEWIQFLHLTDCELPCWINIVPGVTTLSEAQAQVESAYANRLLYDLTRGDYYYKVVYRLTGQQVRIWFRSDDGEMTGNSLIRIIFWELGVITKTGIMRPVIADLEAFLGDPEMVRLSSGIETPNIALIYHNARVYTSVDDLECDKVVPNQEAPNIALYDKPPISAAWLSEPQEWRGYDYCYNFERKLQ